MNLSELYYEAAHHLRISASQVEKIVRTAPFRYKHYTILKRNGGQRDIYHPSPVLKSIQRWLVRGPLALLPVHDSVYSYRVGRNVAMNAAMHARSSYFVRFDFSAFFPSISEIVLERFLRDASLRGFVNLDDDAISAVVRVACCRSRQSARSGLSVGAPSSPALSNALLFDFDCEVYRHALAARIVYTRYADDMFLSSVEPKALAEFEREFRTIVAQRVPYLTLNEDKKQHFSRRRRVTITGVNVTSDRRISVGRSLKRSIRTRLHLALNGQLQPSELSRLRGAIAHVMSVEPAFLVSLREKFGSARVEAFMQFSLSNAESGSK